MFSSLTGQKAIQGFKNGGLHNRTGLEYAGVESGVQTFHRSAWRGPLKHVNEAFLISVHVCLCSYRNLATEHETLMQKYLHLLQIVETEKTVAKQLRQQIEDGEIEIERLKSEVTWSTWVCVKRFFGFTIFQEIWRDKEGKRETK